jgi:hypothetical protein
MYVHFTNAVCALLMPVAHPTVCAWHLQDLGHLAFLAGSFRPCSDPPPCTYILQGMYML